MQLTSGWLIGALILLAIVATGLTVRLLPKASGRGPRQVLARLGLLAACQVSLVLALAAGMNGYFLFYVTWGDLLGTTGGGPGKVREGAPGSPGAAAGRPLPRVISPLGATSGLRSDDRDGRLDEVTIPGPRTGLRVKAYVYLPPQYFQPRFERRRFPVTLVLAGYPGDPRGIIKRQGMLKDASTGIKTGRIQPTVYVITRSMVAPPRDTECTDVPGGPQAESFFSQDVPEAIADTYRVAAGSQGWGVMGQSTGGYCAAKLAMRHSDRFAAGASLGGYLRAVQDRSTGDLYGGSRQVRDDNDLIWRLEHRPAPPVSLLLAQTEQGPEFDQAQRFVKAAKPPLQVATLFPRDGGHNLRTFQRLTPELLRWMSGRLKVV
ncbi:alpha/beta hydrolase-fold protein [Actinomadura vinacea]|uniref:Alpha/beta hydrolase-fold protein n=1 Tax=Actinomadura vinacea TaxID=115336 RepID=A0ABN3JEC2_9ACTN